MNEQETRRLIETLNIELIYNNRYMQFSHTYKNITWTNLEKPTPEEVRELMEKHDLHHVVAEEILEPTLRDKVDMHSNCLYLVLHFPNPKNTKPGRNTKEIDFIIGKDFIITAHYDTVDPLHTFSRMFEVNSILDKNNVGNHAGFLFFYMVRDIYRNLGLELEEVDKDLYYIEERIFLGQEKRMVEKISKANRALLETKQSLRFHSKILESLENAGSAFFGNGFHYYLRSITNEYHKVYDLVLGQKEMLNDLKNTNDALLTNRTNDIMRALTVIAFTVTPISMATQLLAMNTNVSFLQNITDTAFFVVIGITSLIALGMFYYFKKKNWF